MTCLASGARSRSVMVRSALTSGEIGGAPAGPCAAAWIATARKAAASLTTFATLIDSSEVGLTLQRVRLLPDFDEADLVHTALGDDEVSVACRHHIADDAAASRDDPCLEPFSPGIEP